MRRPLRGHNDTPFGWPTPGRSIGRPEVGHSQDVFGVFFCYELVMLLLNMVCLTVELAYCELRVRSRSVGKHPLPATREFRA
jgi:hypothetical protein